MTELEILLGSALAVLVVLTVIGFYLASTYYRRWQARQSKAFEMGGRQVRGDMYQLLGTFAMLNDYEQIMTLSTTPRQGSLDLIGVKVDAVDFIEFKKKGGALQGPERKIQKLIEQKKVNYVIKDVDLPEGFAITDRDEARFDPTKFEPVPFDPKDKTQEKAEK
ncbi:MAG: hypothetical protein HY296_04605 [Thaumarchaeota archaeon]|nr:hypothetical protein [Nitrososphaerota archaeon]